MDQRQQFGFTGDETAPTDSGFIQNGFNDLTKTEPLTPLQSGFVDQNFDGGNGFVPGFGQNIDPDATLPVSYPNDPSNFRPVAGWLVSIDGPTRGRDYVIRPGQNTIGRANTNHIVITGDDTISRERECRIVFDPRSRFFYFAPDNGASMLRVNDNPEPVMMPVKLNAYDVLTIGTTKLMFVPLCGEQFSWDE